jgi:predicted ATP-dependent protease
MNLITNLITEMERQDRVNDIDLSGVVEILHEANKAYDKAIAVTHCCMSDSGQLCKTANTIKSRLRMEDDKSTYCKDCKKWFA